LNNILDAIAKMDERELDRLQAALNHRRGFLKKNQSTVQERCEHRNGVLQLEGCAYRRKKDGELTERGPYWYFTTEKVENSAPSTSVRPIIRRRKRTRSWREGDD